MAKTEMTINQKKRVKLTVTELTIILSKSVLKQFKKRIRERKRLKHTTVAG